MKVNIKNILAGLGTCAIIVVSLIVGLSSFANYDLWQGDESGVIEYDGNLVADGDVASSPDDAKVCGYQKSYNGFSYSGFGIAFDNKNKNILVSELNTRKIMKVNDAGKSDYSSTGYAQGMVFDNNGNMYAVYPETNLNLLKKFDPSGKEINSWNKYKQGGNSITFYQPGYITYASSINKFYIAQISNSSTTTIGRFNLSGGPVMESIVGTNGPGYGNYSSIGGIASDIQGNLYVADTNANKIVKYPVSGSPSEWGGAGDADGKFNKPIGIAVGPDNLIYVVDSGNNRIQSFTSGGVFVTKFGQSGSGEFGDFKNPKNIAFDQDGNMYVMDGGNDRVQKFGKPCGIVNIVKNTQPQSDQEFDFWLGAPMNKDFKLKNKGTSSFAIMNQIMSPSFGENPTEGYNTSVSCTSSPNPLPKGDSVKILSKNSAQVHLNTGATVTCTFTNCKVGQVCSVSNKTPITE